jgi:hypothetical protein
LLQSKASSLCHLTLQGLHCYHNNIPWPELDVAEFAAAIGGLSLLQSLTLEEFPNPELSALTLCQLSTHKNLQKLSIKGYKSFNATNNDVADNEAIVNAVSVMLQSHVPLEVLELRNVHFSQAGMESLVQSLESCTSLMDLSLGGDMVDEAKQEIVRFLRAPRSAETCHIRRLCLRATRGATNLFLSVLTADLSEQQLTTISIGSFLHALSLPDVFEDIDELLNVLVAGEHRLSSLSLGCVSDTSWSQFTRHLPNMLHLRELHLKTLIKWHVSSTTGMDFVRAMRTNGSLHLVSEVSFYDIPIEYGMGPSPLFTAAELQQIGIYCQRNQVTRELLQNSFSQSNDARDCVGSAKTSLSLLPKLFHVMKPARRMAPNSIFLGLLCCTGGSNGDSVIGPHGHNKRLGPL